MGQTIGWYTPTGDKYHYKGAEGVPDHFTDKFKGRWKWFQTILDVDYESVPGCNCGDKHYYGCDSRSIIRPRNFEAFREKLGPMLKSNEDGDSIFRDMTDWLERHPTVYVEFS